MNELATLDQPELFYGLEKVDRSQPRYHATAKIFRSQRPAEYRIAVELMGEGKHSIRDIERLLHVSHHTLEAVRLEEAVKLATLREKCARQNLQLHQMCLDRAHELIPGTRDLKDLAISAGIFAEKSQLLAGEATARLESVQPINVIERFQMFCVELSKRIEGRILEAEVIGCSDKNKRANGACPDESNHRLYTRCGTCGERFEGATSHRHSVGREPICLGDPKSDTDLDTDLTRNELRNDAEREAFAATPGRGGSTSGAGGARRDG